MRKKSYDGGRRRLKHHDKTASTKEFKIEVDKGLDGNLASIKQMLGDPPDLVIRQLKVGETEQKIAIIYISGLVKTDFINNNLLKAIKIHVNEGQPWNLETVYQEAVAITDTKQSDKLDSVSLDVLSGWTAFYMDGCDKVLTMNTVGGEKRSIEEPPSEMLIRGPRAGFIENIETNLALLRQAVKDPNLRFESHKVGRRSKQQLVVAYMAGIVNSDLVKVLDERLRSIDTDHAIDSGTVEQWIEDSFLSPFPQLIGTERPDRVTSALLEGKIAVFLDGSPFVLIAPVTLVDTLKSQEDYTQRWVTGTLVRLLRYLSAFIALLLPALYIAGVSYHPAMLPTRLVFSIAGSREGVPFPAVIEAIAMAVTFEILHEASIRLPKIIGSTIGIVGGLVIGESAVTAGIVSPVMVVVTALTAIASFTISEYSVAIAFRFIRFAFMIAAAFLGLYGIVLVYIMLNIHLVNLKSFGIPYTVPFAPSFFKDWKDMFLRAPLLMMRRRPAHLETKDRKSARKGGDPR
ncbi:spore germination protein [Sediminibacillus halophilus]|uniref:Spore germination protein n=1 Tax=Sediminibacillus halophilus TaxID=482461 RepID=A0A1G9PA49_9BACI|nr:spore germination protein [Sediminibacillus halophilus]SDL95658.1 spore germination protein [Sediminibacillus halophilus]